MLKNYFITAINNLIKNKIYSAINIIGLAIGLAACIVITLYVRDQTSYDKQWKDYDRIYRVNFSVQPPGRERLRWSTAPVPTGPALEEYFKDKIEQSARTYGSTYGGPVVIDTGTTKFREIIVYVDPSFIEIFQFKVLAGSLEDTLTDRNNIALSEKVARRYFGSQNPIGKVITTGTGKNKADHKVTAVYHIPGNTIFDFISLLSLLDDKIAPPSRLEWAAPSSGTYFKLKKGMDIETLRPLLPAFIDRHASMSDPTRKASDAFSLDFQKLEMAHLDSPWDRYRAGGSKMMVMAFAGISLLILLIGCINFTILTTAKATQRAREVAMRKVAGAKRKQLILQFIGESTFIVFLSMILSIGVVEIMLPLFESIVGKSFSLNYTSPSTFLALLALIFIVGISGGLYPAVVLSGFRPGDTLKANQSKETRGSISLRHVLVIIQFSVSIILIISTGVIYAQMKYSMNRDLGYNKDNLLLINGLALDEKIRGKINVLKQELLNLADVTDVGVSAFQPSHQKVDNNYDFTLPGHPETSYLVPIMQICDDYIKTYQIPIIAGRDFSMDRDIPEPAAIDGNESKRLLKGYAVINESAVRRFGFTDAEDAVGKIINTNSGNFLLNFTIIGVVSDNHLFSINAPPKAEVYSLNPRSANFMAVRFKGSPKKILTQVNSVWKNVLGDEEIDTDFVDQLVAREFEQERTEEQIFVSFSILAILIACLGLFGSASFTVERRTKEIGLRKVMGAKVKNIVSLLLWQFSKPVLIATIIAWPVAIFAMQSWLERFQYQINPLLMIPICLVSGLIALVIAWLTVGGNTMRVAKSRPIKALRYE